MAAVAGDVAGRFVAPGSGSRETLLADTTSRGRRGGRQRLAVDVARAAQRGLPADLRGLTLAEAKGGRVTVWYEEMAVDRYTGLDKQVEVPYTGVVLGIHYLNGISVRFDHAVGADGKPERIHISNEDDWAWGKKQIKPATWTLAATPSRRSPQCWARSSTCSRCSSEV